AYFQPGFHSGGVWIGTLFSVAAPGRVSGHLAVGELGPRHFARAWHIISWSPASHAARSAPGLWPLRRDLGPDAFAHPVDAVYHRVVLARAIYQTGTDYLGVRRASADLNRVGCARRSRFLPVCAPWFRAATAAPAET